MRSTHRSMAIAALLLFAGSISANASTVRGQLLCSGGRAPASGIAVTVFSRIRGRSTASFTGGDGMYYLLNIPPGSYTLEIWLSRQIAAPTMTYAINVFDPATDLPRVFLPACYAQ